MPETANLPQQVGTSIRTKTQLDISLPRVVRSEVKLTSNPESHEGYKYAQNEDSGAAKQTSDVHMSEESAKYLLAVGRHSRR
jgi:hypothetical protein